MKGKEHWNLTENNTDLKLALRGTFHSKIALKGKDQY
jgi:hypothetical protein